MSEDEKVDTYLSKVAEFFARVRFHEEEPSLKVEVESRGDYVVFGVFEEVPFDGGAEAEQT
jgi:hypothetical protein